MTAFRFRFAVLRTAVMKISIPADSHLVQRRFGFRLERVLHVRNTQLKNEEFKLEALLQQRVRMEGEIAAADTPFWLVSGRQLNRQPIREAPTCWSFERFKQRATRDRNEALRRLAAQDALVDKQRAAIVEARRNVMLLENCARNGTLPGREKRIESWKN